MIKRRSVRIKVLQALYGFEHSDALPLSHFIKQLEERIRSVSDLYYFNLAVIQHLARLVEQDADNRKTKFLKTDEDTSFNTKLTSNTFIKLLDHSDDFNRAVSEADILDQLDDALFAKWYTKLQGSADYKAYLKDDREFDVQSDLKLIRNIYDEIFLEDEDYHNYVEDLWNNWIDDADIVTANVRQTIEKSKSVLKLSTDREQYQAKTDELVAFATELLEHGVRDKDYHISLISSKLNNWDIDRLASTDILILRLALSELLNFPLIPTKVSINEYIDIAKEYSTPKSKDFVNGILDNLTKELIDKEIIVKEGRGLKES